jgi:hypothetical protein
MAKRRTTWNEQKIEKYIKDGRGRGELNNYKPWLTNQDFASKGRTHRPKSWKTDRLMQLFSDVEESYMYILDWADNVFDIREQFPLERELTLKIADQKKIKHPIDKNTGTPIVMTTDFLITVKKENGYIFWARSIKPAKELNDTRVIEKLEIERQYWENQGVDWKIVTEDDISKNLWKNIQYIHQSYKIEEENRFFAGLLYNELCNNEGMIIRIINFFEKKYKLEDGLGISLFKYLLATRKVRVNMLDSINLREDVSILSFNDPQDEGKIS